MTSRYWLAHMALMARPRVVDVDMTSRSRVGGGTITRIVSGRVASRSEDGVALVLVLFAVALLMAAGLLYLTLAMSDFQVAKNERNTALAFNVAEAGVDWVRASLPDNPNLRGTFQRDDFGGPRFEVEIVEPVPGQLTVTSTGYSGDARRTVVVTLRCGTRQAFTRTVFGNSNLIIPEDSVITGDVHLNGDAAIMGDKKKQPQINGRLTVSGIISVEAPPPNITGGYSQGAATEEFPTQTQEWYRSQATQTVTGPVTYRKRTNFGTGLIFVEGDVTLSDGIQGQAIVVATGSIRINKNVDYLDSDSLIILVGLRGIRVHQNVSVDAVLYSPAVIELGGHNEVYGGVYGDSIQTDEKLYLKVTFDERVPGTTITGILGSSWDLESWEAP